MTTNDKRRIVGRRFTELPAALRRWFLEITDIPGEALCMAPKDIDRFWRAHGHTLIEEYATTTPGRRPDAWWQHDAPELRLRLGGVGVEAHEKLAYARAYHHGVGRYFIECDDNDLPYFESEAALLRRHGLFLLGEEARLPPDAYDDEEIDPSRILRWRPIEELNAEYAERKAAGTLGQHDSRFDK